MLQNRSRFALIGLAFVLSLPMVGCDSAPAQKAPTIDVESKPSAPKAENSLTPAGPLRK